MKNKQSSTDSELEKRLYKRIYEEYMDFREHYNRYIHTCVFLLIVIPLVFVALMIGLESKLIFMTLWIVSILAIIAAIVIIEYRDYWYRDMLELDDKPEKTEKNTAKEDDK